MKYRRHLYLDQTQTYGDIELGRQIKFYPKLDCTMKLWAKQWKSDTSLFHLIMKKGNYVHVCCSKQ